MREAVNTGGFVYPVILDAAQPGQSVDRGITRRDRLAGLAMAGIVSGTHSATDSMHPTTALEVARAAYHLADLMIQTSAEDLPQPRAREPEKVG